MGLLKAGIGAAGGVLADSWREYFYCDALDANTLVAKGQKCTSDKGRSSNTRGESNIISDGSIIAVNEGQFMIIVEQGAIVEACGEAGEFVFDKSTEPSLFFGEASLGDRLMASFERVGTKTSAYTSSTRRKSWATNMAPPRPCPSASSTTTSA